MRRIAASVAALMLLASPARAITDSERVKMEAAIAANRASMEESDRSMRDYRAARQVERRAICAKLGGAAIGMTPSQIYKSCWGSPLKVNETITARGRHEQWVYGGGYLYLDNGVVTSIQTSR
jgi:hypothetical protein